MDEKQQIDATPALPGPLGCVELWAGNDLTHRQVKLAGLEADVFSQPSGAPEGGDLFALFSCAGAREARIVLADCTGHGHAASLVAALVHGLIHRYRDIPDNSHLLRALNEEFAVSGRELEGPFCLSTAVLATFDRQTGEFNFAYRRIPGCFCGARRIAAGSRSTARPDSPLAPLQGPRTPTRVFVSNLRTSP